MADIYLEILATFVVICIGFSGAVLLIQSC